MTDDEEYQQLGFLLSQMPPLGDNKHILSVEDLKWLGRVLALASDILDLSDSIQLNVAAKNLNTMLRESNAQIITLLLYKALAISEKSVSRTMMGGFIPTGSTFDAFANISKLFSGAERELFIVDPYADHILLTDFASGVREGVLLKVLADASAKKDTLKVGAQRWSQQFEQLKPLEVRLAKSRSLHDRLIVLDETEVYSIGQSFNQLAKRASTTIQRLDAEVGQLKLEAMQTLWNEAAVIQ